MAVERIVKKKTVSMIPEPKYFIYMMTLHDTGHYYVGMTKELQKRQDCHYNHIRSLIIGKKTHDFMQTFSRRKKKIPFTPNEGYKVHWFFAQKIFPQVCHFVTPGKTITWYYSFRVIHSCYTVTEAIHLENLYLQASKGKPLCLNTQFTSSYNKKEDNEA